jgi:signal transduction histidine kinase
LSTGLQLMAYNMAAEDPNQDIISRLQSDCDRLEAQMKSVLAFSKPTDYEMDAVDIGLLINRISERLKPRMEPLNIELLLQITPDLPPVHGDHRPLEQVFTNLINNAMQAMENQGGTIAIRVAHGENHGNLHYIEINIADNGPGIPAENLDRVFQPFFTTRSKGTGLGLAITKRIITAHRGNISVDSFPGGTVFKVQLPAAVATIY